MKTMLRMLSFDRQVVTQMKNANMDPAYLYTLLYAGKLTMQEFLLAAKKKAIIAREIISPEYLNGSACIAPRNFKVG